MTLGTELFFATLVEHLQHFPGRIAADITAFGPPVTDWPDTWRRLHAALGLPEQPKAGEHDVYFTNAHTLGLRTERGLYRYLRGFHGPLIAGHKLHGPDDTDWTQFLHDL